jgi:hypothetical protein
VTVHTGMTEGTKQRKEKGDGKEEIMVIEI